MLVYVEVSGGLELLCKGKKDHEFIVEKEQLTMKELLVLMKERIITERIELFMQGEGLRPGVLALINEVDWELEGTLEYSIKDKDRILFISTLHGG